MTTLQVLCRCGRKLAKIEAMDVATTICQRTCKCGDVWQCIVTPLSFKKIKGAKAHKVEQRWIGYSERLRRACATL